MFAASPVWQQPISSPPDVASGGVGSSGISSGSSVRHPSTVSLSTIGSFLSLTNMADSENCNEIKANSTTSSSSSNDGAAAAAEASEAIVPSSSLPPDILRKLKPVCVDPGMIQQSMSAQELRTIAFPADFSLVNWDQSIRIGGIPVAEPGDANNNSTNDSTRTTLLDLQTKSERWCQTVTTRTVSRFGADLHRWEERGPAGDGTNSSECRRSRRVRLVTGVVPIMADGRILLISSNKKPEWILPKGGWDNDEELEESAIREGFEEAGVVGVLGPPLQPVYHETRKARKRRMDGETKILPVVAAASSPVADIDKNDQLSSTAMTSASSTTTTNSSSIVGPVDISQTTTTTTTPNQVIVVADRVGSVSPSSCSSSVSQQQQQQHAGSSTTSKQQQQHTHVRMTLFPMYVRQIHEDWPESGRLRKAVPLDQAMECLSSRPEFHSALEELRIRNLHIVADGSCNRSGGGERLQKQQQ